MKGKFITFEGPDGAGKSTQVSRLATYLRSLDYQVLTTREPGGTQTAEKIRTILLDPQNQLLTHRAEAMLYAAARAQHVEELILPALADGSFVICDRFTDSTLAYQGYGRGQDLELLRRLNGMATQGLEPDLTVLLDLPAETGLQRIRDQRQGSGDRLEQQALSFHQQVRQGFLTLAAENPRRIKVVPADASADEIFREIRQHIEKLLQTAPAENGPEI